MKVLEYIQSESDRQSATLAETIGMVEAWRYVTGLLSFPGTETICHMSKLITGNSEFRKVPAVFNQGQPAVAHELIPRLMFQWNGYAYAFGQDPEEQDKVMKEFLEIHPFADGNGRVASLLYNYLRGTLFDPEPLPYYFANGTI